MNIRMTVTAAAAVVLTSTILFPLFIDSLWFVYATGGVATVAAVGLLTRIRRLPVLVGLAGSLAGFVLYLNLVFEPRGSLLFVIPTPGSLHHLTELVSTGMHNANQYAPAVPNMPGLIFLATGGVGITAVMTDLIAVRLRSAALAGLPLLVLFSVPVMLNAGKDQVVAALVFCLGGAGYLAMLSADGRERIRVWGRLVSLWRGSPAVKKGEAATRGPDTRALAAAGRRVGLASIVLALCAPLLLPGLHPSKVLTSGPGIGGTGGSGPGYAPGLSGVAAQTLKQLRERPTVAFTYTTNAPKSVQQNDPQYLPEYDFETLTPTQGWVSAGYGLGATPVSGTLPPETGLADITASTITTTVHLSRNFPVAANLPMFLPLFFPATSLSATGAWMVDPDLMVYSDGGSMVGKSYQFKSMVVDPTPTELGEAPAPAVNVGPDLQLPSSYKAPALEKLARSITNGYGTEFAKAEAIASWLQDVGSYSSSAPEFSTASGLITFLNKTRSGVCVQFAWAMTVLARLVGIPARFVAGYTAGSEIKNGSYMVMNTDAHAWPEIYFQGYGWLRFEPTPPGQGTASDPNYMGTKDQLGSGGGSGILPGVGGTEPTSSPSASANANHHFLHGTGQGSPGGAGAVSAKGPASTPWTAIALAVIAAIVLAGALIMMLAPPAQQVLAGRADTARRKPVSITSVVVLLAATGLVALALYRLLSRTSGLNLGTGWATVGTVFAATAAVVLVAPATFRVLRRRWRWARAGDDATRAHTAWREFHDDLADFGVGSRASEPPRTLAGRVTATLPAPAAEAVRRIALAEERASYAGRAAAEPQLRRDAATARRGLAASARRDIRWRALIFPSSLLTAVAEGWSRVPERIARLKPRRRVRRDGDGTAPP